MDRLPQELLARIAGYLPDQQEENQIRSTLATLSRPWQYAIETFTFASLRITSNDLEEFKLVFTASTTRRRFLQDLHLKVVLPQYSDEDCAKYETEDDRIANDHAFIQHLSTLLHELSHWPVAGKLNLVIDMYSTSDRTHLRARPGDPLNDRFRYSYIRFANAVSKVVPRVTSLYVQSGPRFPDPASLVALTAAFPNLERINWPFEDPAHYPALRRQKMHDFSRAIASFQPPSTCKTLYIHVNTPWYPHKERLHDLTSGHDSICGALRAMLGRSNIQRLDFEGPIDPTLFWPQRAFPPYKNDTCSWKSLREIEVRFSLGSLAGQWFFKGLPGDPFYDEASDVPISLGAESHLLPPGYYDSDEQNAEAAARARAMEMPEDEHGFTKDGCEFRCVPRDKAILPLLAAVARRRFAASIWRLRCSSTRGCGFSCTKRRARRAIGTNTWIACMATLCRAPGYSCTPKTGDPTKRQLLCCAGLAKLVVERMLLLRFFRSCTR